MKILSLEFSSPQRSVAACDTGPAVGAHPPPGNPSAGLLLSSVRTRGFAVATEGRETKAFALIEAALAAAQWQREEVECLAVGLGPGSYTGIRMAIAIAQGWQLGREVKLLGISSVECLAAQLQSAEYEVRSVKYAHLPPSSEPRRFTIIVDAQRHEFYLATYEITPASRREVEPLHLVSMAEVQRRVQAGESVAGPEATQWFSSARLLFPSAGHLGGLAFGHSDFVSGEALEPIYLRPTAFVKAPPSRFNSLPNEPGRT